jgi:hypothetical protein
MSESSKKSRKKKHLPKNVEELTDDEVAKKLFGSKAVKEMNKIVDHKPPKN